MIIKIKISKRLFDKTPLALDCLNKKKFLVGLGGRGFAPPRQRGQIGLKCFKGIVFMGLIAIQAALYRDENLPFNTKETVLMLIAWVFITKKRCLSV